MTYDTKTRTILVNADSDVLLDLGIVYLNELREDALLPTSSKQLTEDWTTVATWLKCPSGEFNEEHQNTIQLAWKAYLAIGLAPSFKLQSVFDTFHEKYKTAGFKTAVHKAPPAVMDVFDRLLADEADIAKKKAFDQAEDRKKIDAVLSGLSPQRKATRQKRRMLPSTRKWRIICSASVAWLTWVLYRTDSDHELLGFELYEWNYDAFYVNAFGPIVVGVIGVWVYNWIIKAT